MLSVNPALLPVIGAGCLFRECGAPCRFSFILELKRSDRSEYLLCELCASSSVLFVLVPLFLTDKL